MCGVTARWGALHSDRSGVDVTPEKGRVKANDDLISEADPV
jgi:hypothetical protein